MKRREMRLVAGLLVAFAAAACGGSGASVPAESDITSGAKVVAPSDDPKPVSPITSYECKTGRPFYDGAVHTVTFSLRGDELASHVAATPASSILVALDDATHLTHDGGRLVIDGDDAELVLYDNSDLTKGYVVAQNNHADVFCTKTK
jgi:hypothetical protein